MGTRPVSADAEAAGWRLLAPHDGRAQGLVVSGFGKLPCGRALFLELHQPGGGWLDALQAVAPITSAAGNQPHAAALGITWSGLQRMGLDAAALAGFDRPFKEGMFQPDRLRRLGDRRGSEWLETTMPEGPTWSGNAPAADDATVATPVTVHAMLLLYTGDDAAAEAWCAQVSAALAPNGAEVVHRLELDLKTDERGIAREHFGYADGISQPLPYAEGVVAARNGTPITQATDPWNAVPLGEVLIGYRNGHNEVPTGPAVPAGEAAQAAGLPPHQKAEGHCDLGQDGSYLVVRELRQHVASFWQSHARAAEAIRAGDPSATNVTPEWIADRAVGRDRDGHLLCPGGLLAPTASGQPDNAFGFWDRDRNGTGCPVGAHVRRGNPRDGLAPTEKDKPALLAAANNHRLLRRGRSYGPPVVDPLVDDGANRGLLFICLNTDIGRQFEFVQQTWVLNPNFATLYDEVDPLIGPRGTMTIRESPLRRIVKLETFVQFAGGEYFFLPSLPALAYLASL